MFAKWWQVPIYRYAASKDTDVIDFVNTVQGKERLKHRDAIDDILTGPARRCVLLSLTRLPTLASAPPRPFWPASGRGPKDLDSYGFPDGFLCSFDHKTKSELRERLATEKVAKQIQQTIEADHKRKEFATSRQEAHYARRRYGR
jgi:hypothetical protein